MKIPEHIIEILNKIEKNNFEAFVVGGCVRDLLMEKEPKDWDITTNARPEQILNIFPDGKYENFFGTVILPIKDEDENVLDVVEITTYRSEQGYSDRRHPDEITFEDDIEEDLSRRDFTINAMAVRPKIENRLSPDGGKLKINGEDFNNYEIVDLFGGRIDIEKGIIRAVGEPVDRFKEDACA